MAILCQHSEFIGSRIESHQISIAGAFQGSSPKWPHHESVSPLFILVRGCNSKFLPVPREMPFKCITVFKRHGVGNVNKLYIEREIARTALACDGESNLLIIIAKRPHGLFYDHGDSSPPSPAPGTSAPL